MRGRFGRAIQEADLRPRLGPDGRERSARVFMCASSPAGSTSHPLPPPSWPGARFLLTLTSMLVEARGGIIAYADTDSVFILPPAPAASSPSPAAPIASTDKTRRLR